MHILEELIRHNSISETVFEARDRWGSFCRTSLGSVSFPGERRIPHSTRGSSPNPNPENWDVQQRLISLTEAIAISSSSVLRDI
jgi:hypothetical protein